MDLFRMPKGIIVAQMGLPTNQCFPSGLSNLFFNSLNYKQNYAGPLTWVYYSANRGGRRARPPLTKRSGRKRLCGAGDLLAALVGQLAHDLSEARMF